jgi:exosome complex RNA-binding protein Rrp4
LIIVIGLYKYFTRITKTKQPSKRKILLKKLKNLDFKDTKNIAYTFSTDGYIFVTAKNQNQFNLIEKRLEQYKYKKDVEAISTDLKEDIKKFIKDIK